MKNNYLDLLKIIRSIINNDELDSNGIDYNAIFDLSKRLRVCAYIFNKLDKDAVGEELYLKYSDIYNTAIKRRILYNNEKKNILNDFENNGIRYLPFKGNDINSVYPKGYLREFLDLDILVDDIKKANKIMLNKGYNFEEKSVEIIYKNDNYVIELHKRMFDQLQDFNKYFNDTFNIAVKDEDNKYGYHFDNETFYVYLIAHLYKHSRGLGIGIRNYIDIYYYRLNKELDYKKIDELLNKLNLKEFNDETISLINNLFIEDINNVDLDKYELLVNAGPFGSIKNRFNRDIEEKGRFGYFIYRIFPPFNHMSVLYPIIEKLPFLYPFTFILRFFKILFDKQRRDILKEESNLFNKKK